MSALINRKTVVASVASAIVMFALSLTYHLVLLNDFKRILLPKTVFYPMMILAYLGISMGIVLIYWLNKVRLGPHVSGVFIGMVFGLIVYLIAVTLGFSFNNSLTIQQTLLDMVWQIFEQAIGGLIIAVTFQIFEKGGFFINI